MKKSVLLILILSGCIVSAMAQAILVPLPTKVSNTPATRGYKTAAVNLPFFDDFSASTGVPNTARWINGGVSINNRFASEPITKNVATFDGADASGQPYLANATTPGPSDTLTSQPIQLAAFSPSDSVYLSFYWQAGGIGNVPDQTVENSYYLVLEFKDNAGNWQQVWRQNATGVTTNFAQVFLALKEAKYFHNTFQFRFRNVGVRSGLVDIWNIDYVELNRNRRKNINTTTDIGISQTVTRLLQNYTAMPAHQFRESAEEVMADTVSVTINSLGTMPGAISWRAFLKVEGAATADTFLVDQGLIPSQARQYTLSGTPDIKKLNLPSGNFTLVHGFVLNTEEQNPLQAANDTSFRKTTFADYFAYDDGTAEAGFGFLADGNVTQVATRFQLNKEDQVKGFKIFFPRVGQDLSGRTLTAKVWAETNGKPGKELYQQSFQITYTAGDNQFYEVTFDEPVSVQGAFYLGWSQPANQFYVFGFDRNNHAPGSRYLWTSQTNWQADTYLEGAVMMRPLMTGQALGVEDEDETALIVLYPNPSQGTINITVPYKSLTILDNLGRKVYQDHQSHSKSIDLRSLPAGMYTFIIETGKTVYTRKLIKTL